MKAPFVRARLLVFRSKLLNNLTRVLHPGIYDSGACFQPLRNLQRPICIIDSQDTQAHFCCKLQAQVPEPASASYYADALPWFEATALDRCKNGQASTHEDRRLDR